MHWPVALPLLVSVAHGQLLPDLAPRVPVPEQSESLPAVERGGVGDQGQGALYFEALREVVLESWSGGEVRKMHEGLSASSNLEVPAAGRLAERLAKWRNQPLHEGDLLALADEILIHYDEEGFPMVGVEMPEQDRDGGILRLKVDIGRYASVGVSKPSYGNPDAVRKGLWLERGELIHRRDLDEQMSWLGRNIFRNPRLYVSPGDVPGTADFLIGLEEMKPWMVTGGYENSGTDVLGRDRFLLGAFGMTPGEQLIAWQTVVGAPASSMQAHTLHWEVPFHRLHQLLVIDASYAEVSSLGLSPNGIGGLSLATNEGSSWSLSLAQKFFLPPMGAWRQSITSGVEVKSTDQFALFGAIRLAPGEVRLLQAKVAYDLSREWENAGLSFSASALASPGNLISGNDDADFRAYDPKADSNYHIGRLSGQGWWAFDNDWRIVVRGAGQISDTRLLPVEQFAAGGYQTVRGADERQYFADNGWYLSCEGYTPAVSPCKGVQGRLLGFVDQAWLSNRGGVLGSQSVNSIGLGLRVNVVNRIDIRFDHGWRLDESEQRSHIGLSFSY